MCCFCCRIGIVHLVTIKYYPKKCIRSADVRWRLLSLPFASVQLGNRKLHQMRLFISFAIGAVLSRCAHHLTEDNRPRFNFTYIKFTSTYCTSIVTTIGETVDLLDGSNSPKYEQNRND